MISRYQVTKLSARGTASPVRLLQGALVILVRKQTMLVFREVCLVLETIRTGAMRVIHITVKTEEALSLYCTVLPEFST